MKYAAVAVCGLALVVGCGPTNPATTPASPPAPAAAAGVADPAVAADPVASPAGGSTPVTAEAESAPTTGKVPRTKPATAAEAASILDLRKFPRVGGATQSEDRAGSIARLSYQAKGKVKAVFAEQQQALIKRGFKELPGAYITDESASGTFMRDGYHVSLSVYPSGDEVGVAFTNHGNVALGQLPTPPGVKPLYSNPLTTAYVTDAGVEETAAAVRKLLLAQGWIPYGDAGDSAYYRQNAIKISARVLSAPGQGGKTVIDYGSELLSAELPAPEDAIGLQYSEPPVQLAFDTPQTIPQVYDYYTKELTATGWEVTTDAPIKQDFRWFFIFRNQAKDLIDVTVSEFEGKTRTRVKFQTAEEVAEEERRFKEALAKKNAEKNKPAAPKMKFAIALPAGAESVETEGSEIKFVIPAGKAKEAAQALRKQLVDAGFKELDASLEAMAGALTLKQGEHTIGITYIDTGVLPPEVTISSFGADLEVKR